MHPSTRPLAAGLFCAAITTCLAAQGQTKPIDPANIDTTCAPCKDIFRYANGGWLKRSEIPGDQPRWGSFNELQEQNYAALKDVLTEAATSASSTNTPISGSWEPSTEPAWTLPRSNAPEWARSGGS